MTAGSAAIAASRRPHVAVKADSHVACVFSFRFNAYACNLLWRERPQTRSVADVVYEVFVNMAAVRKIRDLQVSCL